jgi:hypothetical protein
MSLPTFKEVIASPKVPVMAQIASKAAKSRWVRSRN